MPSWNNDGAPKRILALDGGGIRGMLTVGVLERMESLLRERLGAGDAFRLAHYFDLIAGTSTGSIIAAALARGMSVAEIREHYRELGGDIFKKSLFRQGLFRAKYDAARLSRHLQRVLGARTLLGDPSLVTGLLVMCKRIDTGSPWPLTNNPHDRYFAPDSERGTIPNRDYPLWKVVRASTAAPHYFEPEPFTIAQSKGLPTEKGRFVDGGVSPHNNPALQALLYATIGGFGVRWPLAPDRLLLVSVGTGRSDAAVDASFVAAKDALGSLLSLMNDCADLVETMLQLLSNSPTARTIDRPTGTLAGDLLAQKELISYLRYDVELSRGPIEELLGEPIDKKQLASLSEMDAPANLPVLEKIGNALGAKRVLPDHFPAVFDPI